RHPRFDGGFRSHNVNVYPRRPDRAYVGYLDAGVLILDISDRAHPRLVSRLDYHPPLPGFTHTVLPLLERGLLAVTDEAVTDGRDPFHPREVAFAVPRPPEGSRAGAAQINDVYVDERALIYAVDRFTGGLYIYERTD